jgi:hypothetical protein
MCGHIYTESGTRETEGSDPLVEASMDDDDADICFYCDMRKKHTKQNIQ